MKKRIVIAAAFATCLALCAAVWPQKQPAGETPALSTPAAVIATQPEVPKMPGNRQISLRIKRPPSPCLCIEMAACSSIMI